VKVALVHDWLTGMRGGEHMLERLCRLFPDAPIFTLVWKRGALSPAIESHSIHTSFIQRLPAALRLYRWYLPLFPRAIERFRFDGFDAVISSSHCVAKGVRVPRSVFHMSYIHTPMRYIWDLEDQYFPAGRFPWPLSWYVRHTCDELRRWDVATRDGPNVMVTNSANVAARIRRHYARDAEVVFGPVDLVRFTPVESWRDYDLVVSAFAPNKRVDLAIDASRRLGRRLKIVGTGQEDRALRKRAGPGAEFLGWVPDHELPALYAGARALLFPGEEDFGLVPIEALASGCPVVAFGRGGALETVARGASASDLERVARGGTARVPGGVLFGAPTVEALCEARLMLEGHPFEPGALRRLAEPFSAEAFDRRILSAFERGYAAWRAEASSSPLTVHS